MNAVVKIVEDKPDPDAVAYLEGILADVKRGEVMGVLIMTQYKGGALRYQCAGLKDRWNILGWLSHAMHNLQRD